MDEIMFNNVWYDSWSNKIHLWWTKNGVRKKDVFDYEHDYYVKTDQPTGIVDMFGNHMKRKTCERKRDIPKGLHWKDIAEGDIKEEIKFLHKHFDGIDLFPKIENLNVCYYDIEIAVQSDFPKPEEALYPINAIAAYFTKTKAIHVWVPEDFKYVIDYEDYLGQDGKRIPKTFGSISDLRDRLLKETGVSVGDIILKVIPDEQTMVEDFCTTIHKNKTDVLSGWNIDGFDNLYISNRLERLGSQKGLSPIKKVRISEKKDKVKLGGISSMDYLKVYRDKFTFDNKGYYSLNNIANIELKKSKLEYEGTIEEFYKNDWHGFCLYNCIDTLLVAAIDQKKGFMNLALLASHQGKVPLETIIGTLTGLTGLAMDFLHRQGMVLNNKEPNPEEKKYPGGVSWCLPGLYKYGISFDITSMYPHIMARDNIGLETIEIWKDEDLRDIIRIDDVENKRAYFFEPSDQIKVGRVINDKMSIINIFARDVLESDMVIIDDTDKPNWNYNMAIKAEW